MILLIWVLGTYMESMSIEDLKTCTIFKQVLKPQNLQLQIYNVHFESPTVNWSPPLHRYYDSLNANYLNSALEFNYKLPRPVDTFAQHESDTIACQFILDIQIQFLFCLLNGCSRQTTVASLVYAASTSSSTTTQWYHSSHPLYHYALILGASTIPRVRGQFPIYHYYTIVVVAMALLQQRYSSLCSSEMV